MNKFVKRVKDIFSLSFLAKILVVALIVITTLFPSLFDPEHADWKKVLFNLVLSTIIMLGAFISQLLAARKRETEKKSYTDAQDRHVAAIRDIQKKQYSHIHKLYVKDENEKNKLSYIQDAFTQFEIDIKYYKMEQSLVKTALKNGLIDKEQYSVIQLCKKGNIEYDKYDVRDLTATQLLKKYKNTNKSQQAIITASNLMSKMSFMLAFAVIWGMFAYDQASQGGGPQGQAWIDLGARLITFAGGLYTGDVTAREVAEDDIRLFDKFYNFNCKFIQDFENGIWKPQENAVEEDIVERLMKLQQEEENALESAKNEQYVEIEMTEEQIKEFNKNAD